MIGCLIGLAGMGSAVATDFDARDIATGNRAAADNCTHDVGASGGDSLGLNRDASSSKHTADADSNSSDNHGSGAAGGSEHGGGISAPTHARPATLGWQSLLPGSIQ
jgi:hypothetical protein